MQEREMRGVELQLNDYDAHYRRQLTEQHELVRQQRQIAQQLQHLIPLQLPQHPTAQHPDQRSELDHGLETDTYEFGGEWSEGTGDESSDSALAACVLEVGDEIGGHVHTRAFSDALLVNVEVGAAWIHGTLSDEQVQATWRVYELLLKKVQQLSIASEDGEEQAPSLAQLVDRLVAQDAELSTAVANHTNGRLDFCVHLIEIWTGATADALQLDDFVEIDLIGDDPGPHCIVPDGMERFVDRLAEPIAECIQMNTLVKSIAHQGAAADSREGVVIECDDGRMIKADFVIVTSALGLLKAGELSFTPALPQEKQQAIQRSQMGQHTKEV
ncbi:Glucan 1,3-beta-glucosidase [Globisporangium polare]